MNVLSSSESVFVLIQSVTYSMKYVSKIYLLKRKDMQSSRVFSNGFTKYFTYADEGQDFIIPISFLLGNGSGACYTGR
jgi:hypothetical protein